MGETKKKNRKSIRLEGYDYSKEGAYFITICASNRMNYFELYPELRGIVENEWKNLPMRFNHIKLDEFVVMPDHVHGIILIENDVGVGFTPIRLKQWAPARGAPTIGDIIGAYKSICIHEWLEHMKQNDLNYPGKFWQRNYYDRIIRDEIELNEKREYIRNNPILTECKAESFCKSN